MNTKKIDKIAIAIDNYEQTIWAATAFIAIIEHNNNRIAYSYGQKLSSDKGFITPDISISFPDNKFGLIAEQKTGLGNDYRTVQKRLNEFLPRYLNSFENWPGEFEIETHDIIVILPYQKSGINKHLDKYFEENEKRDSISMFSSIPSSDFSSSICLERRWGVISNPILEEIFPISESKCPSRFKLLNKFARVKLLDNRPPISYMCDLIWRSMMPDCLGKNQKKKVPVMIDGLVAKLRDLYAFRDHNNDPSDFPRTNWVIEALELFRKNNFADKKKDKYSIIYKHLREPLETFKRFEVEDSNIKLSLDL